MSNDIKKKGFLECIPSFSLILIMAVLMVIGGALIPLLRIAYHPTPEQGKKLSISFSWPGASQRVIEQEITSKVEGLVSSVVGVEKTTSMSSQGSGSVTVVLKEKVNVSAVRFEISSLLKQIAGKLPEGAGSLYLQGGNISGGLKPNTQQVLSYIINADMDPADIKDYVERNIKPYLTQIDYVRDVSVGGAMPLYLDIEYNPIELQGYGLEPNVIVSGLQNFLGQRSIVGDVDRIDRDGNKERITLLLETEQLGSDIGKTPLATIEGKIIYLSDIAKFDYKKRQETSFYRINGLNTIYLSIFADTETSVIKASAELRERMEKIQANLTDGFYVTLTNDAAKEVREELVKLVKRTFLSLVILFLFVWIVSRSGRYLSIIALSLFANVLISVIFYYLFDVELNLISLAGVAVSFGIMIDTVIVMVDHYSYYHNRSAFIAILAALLTTIGSLVIVFFMPDYVKGALNHFSTIIIINLVVALFVALFFVPAIIDRNGFCRRQAKKSYCRLKRTVRWSRFYSRYIVFTQKRKWIYITVFVLAFGIPIHLLPAKLGKSDYYRTGEKQEPKWYEDVYNKTIGSNFYQGTLRQPLEKVVGGTLRLFSSVHSSRTFSQQERDVKLYISAQLTEGDDAVVLNQKMWQMDHFLAKFKEVKRFVTRVDGKSGSIEVEFADEHKDGAFPQYLESQVIREALLIGGVDWTTSGVSERGFSNSLGLGHKSHRIGLSGYNYDRLYKYAEMVAEKIKSNKRVNDVGIELGNSDYWQSRDEPASEMYIKYDMEKIALNNLNLRQCYSTLAALMDEGAVGTYRNKDQRIAIDYHSSERDKFDVWHLMNSYLTVGDRQVCYAHIGEVGKRNAATRITKTNQEYSLQVAFNFMGSYDLSDKFIKQTTEEVNAILPVGFRTVNESFGWYDDRGSQYWLILLIVVIIFFTCSILFESFRQPFVIISLIPISFIGTFLTFYFSGVNFGTGGFASLVLLSGLVVNAAIYVINEYNSFVNKNIERLNRINPVRLYVKAYNHKIIAVLLTILSTVLGLVPFLIDGPKAEEFWFSFAIGTMGGLLFSIIALVFFMPILMPFRRVLKRKALKNG
ncbi:efflux RND transporter permease subunit [Butyricimonas paravirosa]|uniref:efflux RND transporter permease subunit n=1 Tax=Butyricimonas paravirosa TaxID=1472417 RepID=UPI00210EB5B6|nr:efflux RND transporter permease subunit [Butyricimonas paravirosa]MCQ4875354.1 efflux RND transporter permease subunit [Butyricimonas paravirosa]